MKYNELRKEHDGRLEEQQRRRRTEDSTSKELRHKLIEANQERDRRTSVEVELRSELGALRGEMTRAREKNARKDMVSTMAAESTSWWAKESVSVARTSTQTKMDALGQTEPMWQPLLYEGKKNAKPQPGSKAQPMADAAPEGEDQKASAAEQPAQPSVGSGGAAKPPGDAESRPRRERRDRDDEDRDRDKGDGKERKAPTGDGPEGEDGPVCVCGVRSIGQAW